MLRIINNYLSSLSHDLHHILDHVIGVIDEVDILPSLSPLLHLCLPFLHHHIEVPHLVTGRKLQSYYECQIDVVPIFMLLICKLPSSLSTKRTCN